MDDYTIKTPEQVDLAYTVAGLGTRFVALAIDTAIQAALLVILILSLYKSFDWDDLLTEWYMAAAIIIVALILYGYFFIFELIMKGRTPGKAAMRIRVIRRDGRAVDLPGILVRNLLRLIDSMPTLYTVGIICMFVTQDSRRLGDMVAGTVVVVEGKKTKLDNVISKHGSVADSGLSNKEYAMVRDFLSRSDNLSNAARYAIASDIAATLYDRYGIPYDRRDNPEAFLRSLLRR